MNNQHYLTLCKLIEQQESLSDNEREAIYRNMLSGYHPYIVEDEKGIHFFCTKCNKWHDITKEEKIQMQKSHICKFCGTEFKALGKGSKFTYTKGGYMIDRHKYVDGVDELVCYQAGYFCEMYEKDGNLTFKTDLVHLAIAENWKDVDTTYRRFSKNIALNALGSVFLYRPSQYSNVSHHWHKTNSYYYSYAFDDVDRLVKYYEQKHTLLEYYNSYYLKDMLKSNQKYMILHGIFNHEQMGVIIAFDLKDAKQVYKANTYINSQFLNKEIICAARDYNYNEYTLEYLKKNKINIYDYTDYRNWIKLLGIDAKYPKDFKTAHDVMSAKYEAEKDRQYDEGIRQMHDKLLKYQFSNDKYVIAPFESGEELSIEGKLQSICIGTYKEKYATGRSLLFKVRSVKNIQEPLVAVELNSEHKLIQQRGKYNGVPDRPITQFVKTWLETVVAA